MKTKMATMRALSLWQPWAQFVASRHKRADLRWWKHLPSSLVGQRIAIHAAGTLDPRCDQNPDAFLDRIQRLVGWRPDLDLSALVYGAVLCTVSVPAVRWLEPADAALTLCSCRASGKRVPVGILFDDVLELSSPYDVPGRQGIFYLPAAPILRLSTLPLPFQDATTQHQGTPA